MSLQELAKKYIELDSSEEYKRAQRLVDEKDKIKELIRSTMKKENISKTTVIINNKTIELGFNIRYMSKIDKNLIPPDLRTKCYTQHETWYLYYK